MIISKEIEKDKKNASKIRAFFEKGNELKAKYGAENVADLCLGNPIQEPPLKFVGALVAAAQSPEKGTHRYMPNTGYPQVREKIAEYLNKKKYFEDITADHICMTVGAAGGINTCLKTILNPKEEVILVSPYFAEYIFYVKNHQGRTKVVDSNEDFSLNVKKIKKAINKKTKAILINSPNNPTGKVYSKENLEELVDILQGTEICAISDEPYREIVYKGEFTSIASLYDNSFMVYSFSKSLGIPGERIGYIAVNPKMKDVKEVLAGIAFCNRVRGDVNAPALMQRAVANSLKVLDSDLSSDYKQKSEKITESLNRLGYEFATPEGTFYIWAKCPMPEKEFIDKALEKKLLVAPGSTFGREGWFRIAYCTTDQQIGLGLKILEELYKGK